MAEWVGRCDGLGEEDLYDFDESSEEIDYYQFESCVGKEEIQALEDIYGYSECPGLTLRSDPTVTFAKGEWRGEPAVCMFWSAYHHIWIHNEKNKLETIEGCPM